MTPLDATHSFPRAAQGDWTRRRLWTFRVGVALFAVQMAVALFDASPGTRALAGRLHSAVFAAIAAVLPDTVAAVEHLAARSDAHAVLLELGRDACLAFLLAALWTLCDRRRQHDRLAGAVRVTLRYLVAIVMLVYGGFKVVPVQFPLPSAEDLLRPVGERPPMALLWMFMGASPAYTVFAGLAESVGGALLLWRRTTTLGALLLTGVLTNVVMLNFAYDVPVKRGAALLLLVSLVLASRDAERLARLLLRDLPTQSGGEPAFRAGPRGQRVRVVCKTTIVALAIAGPMVVAVLAGPRYAAIVPLQGAYAVDRFVRDGSEVPPLLTAAKRWRRVVLGDRGGAVVQTMDDRFERFGLTIDEGARTIALTAADQSELRFRYESDAGAALRWIGQGHTIDEVELRRLPDAAVWRVLR